MDCTEYRDRIADRLDDLLEAAVAKRFDAHGDVCATCAVALADGRRMRAALYRPYRVPAAPADLPQRVLARHAPAPRRTIVHLAQYAASFAAGALVTLAVISLRSPPEVATPLATAVEQEPEEPLTVIFPRRIR